MIVVRWANQRLPQGHGQGEGEQHAERAVEKRDGQRGRVAAGMTAARRWWRDELCGVREEAKCAGEVERWQ
jgi:hypothetical protein